MKRIWILSPLLLFNGACGIDKSPQRAQKQFSAFYQNSLRRSAVDSDIAAKAILRIVDRGCTAFFVSNDAGKNIAASAIHCFENQNPSSWCSNGGTAWDTRLQAYRNCTRIVVFNPQTEMFLFEVDGPAPQKSLTLTALKYPVGTRLQMLGYPSDPERARGINVTENCWILKDVAPPDRLTPRTQAMKETHFLHNCSTYGGNSGGPMVLEGTDIAIAMPSSFVKDDFSQRDSRPGDQRAIAGLEFGKFRERNALALNREKIRFLDSIYNGPRPYSSKLVLLPGAYDCSDLPSQEILIKPIYNTSDQLHSITFWYKPKGSAQYGPSLESTCISEAGVTNCKASNSSEEEQFVIRDAQSFSLIKSSGKRHQCQFHRALML
jgi:hypothetical protein